MPAGIPAAQIEYEEYKILTAQTAEQRMRAGELTPAPVFIAASLINVPVRPADFTRRQA
jgi:hypothetical protein